MILNAATGALVARQVRASSAQEMRWRGSAFDSVNRVYRLRGRLVPDAFRQALGAVIGRHEALRCSLRDEGQLMMRVHREVPTPLRRIVAEGATPAEREAWVARWIAEEVKISFNRGEPPLVRATLVRLDASDHVFVLVIDHIIADGWSLEIFARELSEAYRAALGEATAPAAPAEQYPDWVVQDRAALTEERLAARADFWGAKFPGGPQEVAVWLSGYRGPDQNPDQPAGIIETLLDPDVTAGLRQAARNLQATLYSLTATVLVRLLQADTGQERITLSTSSAARFSPQTASMIGYLATTMWVPTTLAGAPALPTEVQAFQRDLHEAMARSDVPARSVFERMWGPQARRLMDAVPQVGFLCTPFWGESLDLPGVQTQASEYDDGSADGALSVYLTDRGSQIEVQVRYLVGALRDGYAQRLSDRYVAELAAAAGRYC